MKKFIQILWLLVPVLLAGQNQRWEVIHGSQYRNESLRHILEDYDRGLFLSGHQWVDYEGDGWGFKTDVNGAMLYEKVVTHGDFTLLLRGATNDMNGNKYVCGTFWDEHSWPFIMKLDSCGSIVWCEALRDDDFDFGYSKNILVANDNMIVLLTNYTNIQNPINIIHIIAFDTDGNKLWMKPYASLNDYPLMETPVCYDFIEFNGCYYIAGFCFYPFPDNPNHLWRRPMFIGIDSLFNEKFVLPFMVSDSVLGNAYSIIPLNDSTLLGVGSNIYPLGTGKISAGLMFIRPDGEEVGHNHATCDQIGPEIMEVIPYDVEKINDTLLLTSSYYGSEAGGNPLGEIIMDTSGKIYKHQSDSSLFNAYMVKTYDDNFLFGGLIRQNNSSWKDIILYKLNDSLESVPFDTTQYVYDSLCPHTIQSGTIDLNDCLTIVDIGELPTPKEYRESIRWIPIKAYPNPVTEGKLTLEFENTEHHKNMELRCYDDFGRQIRNQKIYRGQQDTELDVSNWPPGIYIAVVYSEGSARGKVKFIIQ